MNIPTLTCVLLALACAMRPAPLTAQTIYRCGSAYSQIPCPGGVAIDADDSRTAAQKAQTDAAARQAATSARTMERERLALEKSARITATGKNTGPPPRTLPGKGAPAKGHQPHTDKRKSGATPEHFTAAVHAPETKPGKPGDQTPLPADPKRSGTPVKP